MNGSGSQEGQKTGAWMRFATCCQLARTAPAQCDRARRDLLGRRGAPRRAGAAARRSEQREAAQHGEQKGDPGPHCETGYSAYSANPRPGEAAARPQRRRRGARAGRAARRTPPRAGSGRAPRARGRRRRRSRARTARPRAAAARRRGSGRTAGPGREAGAAARGSPGAAASTTRPRRRSRAARAPRSSAARRRACRSASAARRRGSSTRAARRAAAASPARGSARARRARRAAGRAAACSGRSAPAASRGRGSRRGRTRRGSGRCGGARPARARGRRARSASTGPIPSQSRIANATGAEWSCSNPSQPSRASRWTREESLQASPGWTRKYGLVAKNAAAAIAIESASRRQRRQPATTSGTSRKTPACFALVASPAARPASSSWPPTANASEQATPSVSPASVTAARE